ncbi:MAG: hypothetical protein WA691_09975 [Thermoplasmata archaeon]
MAEYLEETDFPFPIDRVWKLLEAHLDDATLPQIHPKIKAQKTLHRSPNEALVQRTIEARGKLLTSEWRIGFRPPEFLRYDIVSGDGPYATGSFVEIHYSEGPGRTHFRTHVKGRITVVPFFLPQATVLKRVLADIDAEDEAYLRR